MTLLKDPAEIWRIPLKDEDVRTGIEYGSISLAYTFDRMSAQSRPSLRVFRIAVGVAVQSAFERIILERYKTRFIRDTTDYKEEDYWDIASKSGKKLDLKSFHVFTDYENVKRPRLTKSLILGSSSGRDWRTFFPMLIPRDQFDSEEQKDCYVFAILEAPSSKPFPSYVGVAKYLVAIPFSLDRDENARYQIIHRRRYAVERVQEGRTFSLGITRVGQTRLLPNGGAVTVGYGNVRGEAVQKDFRIQVGRSKTIQGLTGFHFLRIHDSPSDRDDSCILRVTFHDVDEEGDIVWNVSPSSFRDVWINNGVVYFIGWISREEFAAARQKRKAYGPREDWQGNTDHRDPSARGLLSRKAFCYFYPPTFHGGLQSHNYYCLPRDLHTMRSLQGILRE